MKIYKLCESSTGCVWNFIIYTGMDTIYGQRNPGEQTSSRIMLEVAHDLLDKGYCLNLDNWYTGPKLVDILCTRKTDVGTMRTNRKEFPDVVCLNAFIIYKKKVGSISRLDFLLTLAESLSSMGGVVEPATRGRPSKSPKPSRLLGRCFPDMVPGLSKKKPTRRCVVCWANGKRKEERVIILVF